MHLNKPSTLAVGALVCGLSAPAAFGEATPTDTAAQLQALKAEVAQLRQNNEQLQGLRSELNEIRSQQDQGWLNERRAQEIKGLIHEVLSDADTRASLMNNAMTAGHDGKGFFLASETNDFRMNVGGQFQFRYIISMRDEPGNTTGSNFDEVESGFQMRRMKLGFSGHVASPKLGYKVTLAANRNDNTVALEEAEFNYKIMDGLTIRGGRFKGPFLREELISSRRQLAVERSLVNELFSTGWMEGVGLAWDSDLFRVGVMLSDGAESGEISSAANDFHRDDRSINGNIMRAGADLAITARVDVKLAGDWKQADEFAAWSKDEMGLFLGGAVHYEIGETGSTSVVSGGSLTARGANNNFLRWTVDGLFKTGGLSIFGAVVGQMDTQKQAASAFESSTEFDDIAAVAQIAYMVIPDKLEPFVRYEWIGFDDARGVNDGHLMTVGANYYLNKHNAKFTADVIWAFSEMHSTLVGSSGQSGLGLLRDGSDQDDQIVFRAQFQMLF